MDNNANLGVWKDGKLMEGIENEDVKRKSNKKRQGERDTNPKFLEGSESESARLRPDMTNTPVGKQNFTIFIYDILYCLEAFSELVVDKAELAIWADYSCDASQGRSPRQRCGNTPLVCWISYHLGTFRSRVHRETTGGHGNLPRNG